jgi:two-component sensor histidine kinase
MASVGEMAARIAAHDWAATPLGPYEAWPERLRAGVDAMLATPLIASLLVGPERILIYNDRAAREYGAKHPVILGAPAAASFAEFERVAGFYDRVFAGESVHVPAQALDSDDDGQEEVYEAYLTPIGDGDGGVLAAQMLGFAIGDRLRAQARLRESEARRGFLLSLSDALRSLDDVEALKHRACELLGRHLGAGRAYFVTINRARDHGEVARDYAAGDRPSLAGRYPFESFRWTYGRVAAGASWAVPDVASEPGLPAREAAFFVERGVIAWINVPLVEAGALQAILCVVEDAPRAWTAGEVALVEETAARLWADVKRAQAEREAQAAAERQALLLAELQHRVRNILAVTRSIVRRSQESAETVEDYAQHLEGRISALARTQVLLTRDTGAGLELEDLLREELLVQVVREDQFRLDGPPVVLSAKAAEVLTLALHELATNATKYGAFSRPDGCARISWAVEHCEGRDWLTLSWSERGITVFDADRRRGFGTALIEERVPYDLDGVGSLELRRDGVEARIAFPLEPGSSILQTREAAK